MAGTGGGQRKQEVSIASDAGEWQEVRIAAEAGERQGMRIGAEAGERQNMYSAAEAGERREMSVAAEAGEWQNVYSAANAGGGRKRQKLQGAAGIGRKRKWQRKAVKGRKKKEGTGHMPMMHRDMMHKDMQEDLMMDRRANILVTGGSSSGKTVAACNTFFKMTIGGGVGTEVSFDLVANGDAAGNDISYFAELYRGMVKGKMPVGNTENDIYEMAFRRNSERVCQISWMDYRGSLRTRRRGEDEEKWEEFLAMLEHATLFIYIISGDLINDYISIKDGSLDDTMEKKEKEVDIAVEVANIKALMETAKSIREDAMDTPILFYVTKSDLIKYDDDGRKIDGLISFLKTNKLLESNHKIMGCHSTLGRDLKLSGDNEIIAGFEPEGFEIPLMLTVGYAISESGKEWEQEEMARLDAAITSYEVYIMEKNQEKGRIDSQFWTKLIGIMKKDRAVMRELENEIEDARKHKGELEAEKATLEQNNRLKQYSKDILHYIEEEAKGEYACGISADGEKIPLGEFFFN